MWKCIALCNIFSALRILGSRDAWPGLAKDPWSCANACASTLPVQIKPYFGKSLLISCKLASLTCNIFDDSLLRLVNQSHFCRDYSPYVIQDDYFDHLERRVLSLTMKRHKYRVETSETSYDLASSNWEHQSSALTAESFSVDRHWFATCNFSMTGRSLHHDLCGIL